LKINFGYLAASVLLFITEIIIALFVHDEIIRPYVGDVLVVILIYTIIRSFLKTEIKYLPFFLFAFACAVELSQFFGLVYLLNLQDNIFIATILGTSYSLVDLLCYFIAMIILVVWEKIILFKVRTSKNDYF